MGSPKAHKVRWYNSLCLWFLKLLRYTVKPTKQTPKGWYHLPVIGLPIAISAISFVTLGKIKAILVFYHLLTLGFRLTIAALEMKNFNSVEDKEMHSMKRDKITPYFLRLSFLIFEVGLLLLLLILALCSAPDITIGTFSSVAVHFGLFFSFFENFISGIVSLYSAKVELPIVVA